MLTCLRAYMLTCGVLDISPGGFHGPSFHAIIYPSTLLLSRGVSLAVRLGSHIHPSPMPIKNKVENNPQFSFKDMRLLVNGWPWRLHLDPALHKTLCKRKSKA